MKDKSQEHPSITNLYNLAIENLVNKYLKKIGFESLCSGNGNGSGEGSFIKSNSICHKFGKIGHLQRYLRLN